MYSSSLSLAIFAIWVAFFAVEGKLLHQSDYFAVYIDDSIPVKDVQTAIVLGVGTQMKKDDYSNLAEAIQINTQNSIVFIMDPNPNFFTKFNPKDFQKGFSAIVAWIKMANYNGVQKYFIGGHSASGQAGIQALQNLKALGVTISGFIGIDPCCIGSSFYPPQLSDNKKTAALFTVPSLFWTTQPNPCTKPTAAGEGFYNLAVSNGRGLCNALFKLKEGPEHCIFTNAGCMWPLTCLCKYAKNQNDGGCNQKGIFNQVAVSIANFVSDKPQIETEGTNLSVNGSCPVAVTGHSDL